MVLSPTVKCPIRGIVRRAATKVVVVMYRHGTQSGDEVTNSKIVKC